MTLRTRALNCVLSRLKQLQTRRQRQLPPVRMRSLVLQLALSPVLAPCKLWEPGANIVDDTIVRAQNSRGGVRYRHEGIK